MTFMRDGVEIDANGKPVGQPDTTTPVEAEAHQKALGERDAAASERDTLKTQVADLTQQVTKLTSERDGLKQKIGTVTTDRDSLKQQVRALTGERDAALKTVKEGNLIPTDAKARLVAVKGIADTLADQALAALTAPAAPASE